MHASRLRIGSVCHVGEATRLPVWERRALDPLRSALYPAVFLTCSGTGLLGSAEPLAMDPLLGTPTRGSFVQVGRIAYSANGSSMRGGEMPARLIIAYALIAAMLLVFGILIFRMVRKRRRRTRRSGFQIRPRRR